MLGAYVVITFWQYRNACADRARRPAATTCGTRSTSPWSCAAGAGACIGFLWWNAAPAKIFMGDTGSLALGGLLAGLSDDHPHRTADGRHRRAVRRRGASVVIQVAVFRSTRQTLFRMAPFHHHFELAGWAETTVIIRFWLLAGDRRGDRARRCSTASTSPRSAAEHPVKDTADTALTPLTALSGAEVLVTGWGISGRAVVGPLHDLGARVTVTDARPASRDEVTALGHESRHRDGTRSLERFALVVTSPGFRPEAPILVAAGRAGIPVWGDIEFTWRVDQAEHYGPTRRWLVVTGTNGKTTTTSMLASVLSAAGLGAIACGNIGLPVLDALHRPEVGGARGRTFVVPALLGAVGAAGRRRRAQHRRRPSRLARRNGRLHRGEAARAGRRRSRRRSRRSGRPLAPCPHTARFPARPARRAANSASSTASWWTARSAAGHSHGTGPIAGISPPGPAGVLDALAAASLARAIGVTPDADRPAWPRTGVGPHRADTVARDRRGRFVDDSKATNPHAARSSLLAHPSVVWLAGGQLKGAAVEDLVAEVAPRLPARC